MERRQFIAGVGATIITAPLMTTATVTNHESGDSALKNGEIQHMVIFDLKYEKGSADAAQFIADGRRILSAIPVVRNFQAFRQTSPKNEYTYGFSMVFNNNDDYQTYNNRPLHVDFVENRWKKEVTRFLEIDFETA